MTKEQAVVYLRFSGFSDEQIKAIEGAFTCDKCVYSTSEGCQYDDITETIPPFETSDDAISREAVINHICESKDCYRDECKGRLYKRCHDLEWVYELSSVNPLPKALTKEERELLQRWRDNRGISMEEFAKALELLEGSGEE